MKHQTLNPSLQFNFAFENKIKPMVFRDPVKIITTHTLDEADNCFTEIQQLSNEGYYVAGFVSYEAAPAFNPRLRVKENSNMPLLWFGVFEEVFRPESIKTTNYQTGQWESNITIDSYINQIYKIHEYIEDGKTEQVNYTLKMKSAFQGDSRAFAENLINAQAADYTAYIDTGRYQIASASPELFFQLQGRVLTTKPMAGTAPRGKTYQEDLAQAKWLKNSKKNQQENNIIAKAMKEELETIANQGQVHITNQHSIEKYPTVYQMTTTLTSELSQDIGLFDIFKAIFPCSSITGLPKKETMDVIFEVEQETRDVYCGAIGYITPNQEAIFNVPIRTAVIDSEKSEAMYGVGGGITRESTAEDEYKEVLTKTAILHTKKTDYNLLESIRLEDGQYFLLKEHLERIKQSASYFDVSIDIEKIKQSLYNFATEHSQSTYKVRLLINQKGEYTIEGKKISEKEQTHIVKIAIQPIDNKNIFHYHKTTFREIYNKHKQANIFDVLLWNDGKEITEFTNGNIVVDINGNLYTPPVSCGLLPGTFRKHLLNENLISEKVIPLDELSSCNAIWFINSVQKWVPVYIKK